MPDHFRLNVRHYRWILTPENELSPWQIIHSAFSNCRRYLRRYDSCCMTQRVWSSYYELLPRNKQKYIDWIYIDCIVLYKSMIRFRKKRDIITKGQMIIGKSASTILFNLDSSKIRFILILKKLFCSVWQISDDSTESIMSSCFWETPKITPRVSR